MTRFLVVTLFGLMVAPLSAEEISSNDRNILDSISQMARLHAQKACLRKAERVRSACETEQIRSLAESAASVPALRPANVMPSTFAAMIEDRARTGSHENWRAGIAREDASVDCRVNVC